MNMENKKKYQIKLTTKEEFELLRSKYVSVDRDSEEKIKRVTEDSTIIALKLSEGSGFSVVGAKILKIEDKNAFNELFSKGFESF